ncbi:sodium-dependent transporter [Psychrobacillus glaciei]|uniref:Sodium-dependent transporter n=1 Tax=Psychrobacillus glaciei TaxID=2283160 RepID=A0A5J6SPE1_9BACI|nr:sodium-dependent transporter [Psychrobacillus glaciei]QFF99795.1 sodium-dependent transporter [Psychrobacillus glaciei]
MEERDHFGSKIGFILAAAGSAIGLGAIWMFPYMAGTNGGSVFVILFIVCTILIGLPILLAEFIIGRKGQADPVSGFKKLAPGKPWFLIGWSGFIFSFIILSFYSVVGGWILSYLIRAITFSLNGTSETFYEDLFNTVISNPLEVLIGQGVFIFLTIWIVSGGIKSGIEKTSKWMMPLLLIFFVVLAIRSLTLEGAMEGIKFLFVPDWSYLNWKTALVALGQTFFSLSVGVSAMITYASYLPKETKLGSSALSVSLLNIGISIMAGLVIFPAVFALGFSPDSGPGLVFIILPAVFKQILFGQFFLILFFILLLLATLTSSISMLEIVVSIGIKSKYDRRKRAAWVYGIYIFIVGIPSALSFGVLSNIHILSMSIFDFADFITSSFGLPLGALFISLFAGYVLSKSELSKELKLNTFLLHAWHIIVRYAAPVAIIIVFVQGIIKVFF